MFILRVKRVTVCGQVYRPPCAVIVGVEDGDPVFGKVNSVYNVGGIPVLWVNLLETLEYSRHYHGYVVNSSTTRTCVQVKKLHSPFPLHIRKLVCTTSSVNTIITLIVVKHHILDTV